MEISPFKIEGAWLLSQAPHIDDRGFFREWYVPEKLRDLPNFCFVPAQGNVSKSKLGVIRGMHYSLATAGQQKWITCTKGKILDVILDLRVDSPTFRSFNSIELSEINGRSVYIESGIAHGFISLSDDSLVTYLTSSTYSSEDEYTINPFDIGIQIQWPKMDYHLSERDKNAPTLDSQMKKGLLPCQK